MAIKTLFSIKDLENLSGVKAHTIRIWEKRYNLLTPERSDTNIRSYNITNLQKLLNVAVLNSCGLKISKISELTELEIQSKVKELTIDNKVDSIPLNDFKIAMLNFDQTLFEVTYSNLLARKSFRDIFFNEFYNLLMDIGYLWSSNSISPVHERFISTLIRQKILINIERIQNSNPKNGKVYVLFLPLNEMHDIGMLYLHYELNLKGYHSIFLGSNIPLADMKELQDVFEEIVFISCFTVEPHASLVKEYLVEFENNILSNSSSHFHLVGKNTKGLAEKMPSKKISIHESLLHLLKEL